MLGLQLVASPPPPPGPDGPRPLVVRQIAEFWKNWNIPVHKWFTRHVYRPMLAAGFTRIQASLAVFFISAFAHEWLVCVPLGIVRVYSFMAMMGQLPLAFLTK